MTIKGRSFTEGRWWKKSTSWLKLFSYIFCRCGTRRKVPSVNQVSITWLVLWNLRSGKSYSWIATRIFGESKFLYLLAKSKSGHRNLCNESLPLDNWRLNVSLPLGNWRLNESLPLVIHCCLEIIFFRVKWDSGQLIRSMFSLPVHFNSKGQPYDV